MTEAREHYDYWNQSRRLKLRMVLQMLAPELRVPAGTSLQMMADTIAMKVQEMVEIDERQKHALIEEGE